MIDIKTNKGLSRDLSYYSKAYNQRQHITYKRNLHKYKQQFMKSFLPFTYNNNLNTNSNNITNQSTNISTNLINNMNEVSNDIYTAAYTLRRILEDYLEIDTTNNIQLHNLLDPAILILYFNRIYINEHELIYDIEQQADKVRYNIMYYIINHIISIIIYNNHNFY